MLLIPTAMTTATILSDRAKVMALATGEFIRCFLIHVLPDGFHRIRHSVFKIPIFSTR